MKFQPATVKDFDDMLYIEDQAHIYPWPESTLLWCLEQPHILCYSAKREREMTSFAIYEHVADEASLLNIAVRPDFQGQGLGRATLVASLNALPAVVNTVFLEVRISNEPAIKLYESIGFSQIGQRKNYYPHISGREHALVYRLDLNAFREGVAANGASTTEQLASIA